MVSVHGLALDGISTTLDDKGKAGLAELRKNAGDDAAYNVVTSTHVKTLFSQLSQIQPQTDAQKAAGVALEGAIKADPSLVDRLDQNLAGNPKLVDTLVGLAKTNPAALQGKVNELLNAPNPQAFSAVVAAIPVQVAAAAPAPPAPKTAAPAAPPKTAVPPAGAPAAAPPAPAAPITVDPAVQARRDLGDLMAMPGAKEFFDKVKANPTLKDAIDIDGLTKDGGDPKKLAALAPSIARLKKDATDDPNFFKTLSEALDNAPPNIVSGIADDIKQHPEKLADDLEDAKKKAEGAGNDPFGLGKIMSFFDSLGGGLGGRIMNVLSGLMEKIVGFFEQLLGGGPSGGTSNNDFGLTRQAGATPPAGMLPATPPATPNSSLATLRQTVAPGS